MKPRLASTTTKRRWALAIQVSVTTILVFALLRRADFPALISLVADLHWGLVLAGSAFVLIAHLLNVARWQQMLQPNRPDYTQLLRFYGAGLFTNSFLPTGFGGDGVRATLVSRSVSSRRALVSVGLDRLLGFVTLALVLTGAVWLGTPAELTLFASDRILELTQWTDWSLITFTGFVIVLLATFLLLLPRAREEMRNVFAQIMQALALRDLKRSLPSGPLATGLLLAALSQLFVIAATWLFLKAVGIDASPASVFWLVLALNLVLLFPITINGLGAREAVYVLILGIYGVDPTTALLAALVNRSILILFSLLGGATWLAGTHLRLRTYS